MILLFSRTFDDGTPTHFVDKILTGIKIHTIRHNTEGQWKVGSEIELVCEGEQFATGIVTKMEYIRIRGIDTVLKCDHVDHANGSMPFYLMLESSVKHLALNDGFDSVEQFFNYFTLPYDGYLIHWDLIKKIAGL